MVLRGAKRQGNAFFLQRQELPHRKTDRFHEVCPREMDALGVHHQAPEVQHLVHHIQQFAGVPFGYVQIAFDLRILLLPYCVGKRRQDEGERGTELVADIGEEVFISEMAFSSLSFLRLWLIR